MGFRTPVFAVRGRRPGPLDDGGGPDRSIAFGLMLRQASGLNIGEIEPDPLPLARLKARSRPPLFKGRKVLSSLSRVDHQFRKTAGVGEEISLEFEDIACASGDEIEKIRF